VKTERFWKFLERAGGLAGLAGTFLTCIIAYYTVAGYYGWNQTNHAQSDSGNAQSLSGGASAGEWPWWAIALGVLGVLLLVTSWAMMTIRLRSEAMSKLPRLGDVSSSPPSPAPLPHPAHPAASTPDSEKATKEKTC
jgi:hypothetical protein